MQDIMLPVDQDSKLAIYIGEKLTGGSHRYDPEFYHAYLLLVDETNGWPVTVLQQLHFDPDSRNAYNLSPYGDVGTSDPLKHGNRLKNVLVFPVLGGKCHDIISIWNDALERSLEIREMKIPFDKLNYKFSAHATNCRAGIIAVLQSIGIDYARGYYMHEAGTECEKIPMEKLRRPASHNDNFSQAIETNDRLMDRLGGNSELNRYIGPVTGPVHVISALRKL